MEQPRPGSLPTDRLALDVQVAILRAFARLSDGRRPVGSEQIVGALQVSPDAVFGSTGFFVDSGWLERVGQGRYVATEALVAYHRRLQGGASHAAVPLLAQSARSSWYWRTLVPSLGGGRLSRYEALVILATEANTAEEHRPRLESLLQWLEFLDLITVDGDDIVASRAASKGPDGPGDVVIAVSADLCLTAADLAALSPEQIRALFEAVENLASLMRRRR
ncbi:hypothetical protein DMB66_53450 [Actinoplanes sp. ATCC 53533]|uniref:hypothetical protein n=1 Tax=Actinoplanes sp. ATCC 53533 TaxID=1288362 RepID=UPI000F76BAE9|nr:hypothetical protein [Actinoplanes sp. ATCC 53533]RSM43465.1 hypothetical protein DMB66_53450 [Actinoplanes sp. ATCC 53533]